MRNEVKKLGSTNYSTSAGSDYFVVGLLDASKKLVSA